MQQLLKKSSLVIAILSALCSEQAFSLMTTFDPQNFARALEILKTAKAQIEETKRAQEELVGTKRLIGNYKTEAQNFKNELLSWRTYYDKLDLLDPEHFSAMRWLGFERMGPQNHAPNAFKLLDDKLFGTNSDIKREDYTDVMQHRHYEREQIARNALLTGIVVAEKNKSNLNESKRRMVSATDKSIQASDLISLLKIQNELLSVMASELMQQRELQAQMLEFMTAHAANQYGTSRNEKPQKSTFKSSF